MLQRGETAQEKDCKGNFTFTTSLIRRKEPPGPSHVPREPPELEQGGQVTYGERFGFQDIA